MILECIPEAINNGKSYVEKICHELATMTERIGDDSEYHTNDMYYRIGKKAESVYIWALELALRMEQIVSAIDGHESGMSRAEPGRLLKASGIKFDVELDCDTKHFSCRIMAPPFIKNSRMTRQYLNLITEELQCEVIKQVVDSGLRKMNAVYVIYVNHFTPNGCGKKQPYFDNDNLAIKGLLDAVVPYLCVDDAYLYCDNLYLAQPDTENYAEIIIIPKGELRRWLEAHTKLTLSQEILEKQIQL